MKKLNISLCIVIAAHLSYVQNIKGEFINEQQRLSFSGDTVTYYLLSGGGIVSEYEGTGTYYIRNKRIFISPFLPETKEFTVELSERKNPDLCYCSIISDSATALPASVLCFSNGKAIFGTASYGFVRIAQKQMRSIDSIEVNCIGYKTAAFKISADLKDYKISLVKGLDIQSQIDFISNKGKGYPIKIKSTSLSLKFSGKHGHKEKNTWVAFYKK